MHNMIITLINKKIYLSVFFLIFFCSTLYSESNELDNAPGWVLGNHSYESNRVFVTGESVINNNFFAAYLEALSHARKALFWKIISIFRDYIDVTGDESVDISNVIVKSSFVNDIWISPENSLYLELAAVRSSLLDRKILLCDKYFNGNIVNDYKWDLSCIFSAAGVASQYTHEVAIKENGNWLRFDNSLNDIFQYFPKFNDHKNWPDWVEKPNKGFQIEECQLCTIGVSKILNGNIIKAKKTAYKRAIQELSRSIAVKVIIKEVIREKEIEEKMYSYQSLEENQYISKSIYDKLSNLAKLKDTWVSKSNNVYVRVILNPSENYLHVVNKKSSKDTKPPLIEVITEKDRKFIQATLSIKGIAIDESGVAIVRINQKEASLDSEGNFESTVLLKPGFNDILITAIDTNENQSETILSIFRENKKSDRKNIIPQKYLSNWYHNQYILVVGINKYKNIGINPLQNAINDANAVSYMFNKMGFEVKELYNENATKNGILKSFYDIMKKIHKNDSFIFYYAGHGQGFTLKNKERIGYIVPYDADINLSEQDLFLYDQEAIQLNTIRKYCKNMYAKHIALIFDCCFAGLAMKRGISIINNYNTNYYNDILNRKAINILTAGDDQPVSDGNINSPFTKAILNGISNKGCDLNDRDGFITFTQLAVYVKNKVEKATGRRQRPQFDNLSLDDGDFLFHVKQ